MQIVYLRNLLSLAKNFVLIDYLSLVQPCGIRQEPLVKLETDLRVMIELGGGQRGKFRTWVEWGKVMED